MNKPVAYIHPEAKIGLNVIIEPFTYIDKNVVIGDDCWIGPNVSIWEGARIGRKCKIFHGAQISAVPQDKKYENEITETIIGDNSIIREFVTISRGTKASNRTVLGTDCLIMAYVHIAHDCILGNGLVISNLVQVAGHVVIGDYSVIGGTSAIRQFVNIGSHTMIAGGSLVRKDVPPYVSAAREPLSYSGINVIGLKRRGFTSKELNQIQDIYRIVYLSDMNITRAIDKIVDEIDPSEHRDKILDFIRDSERGIMKGVD